MISMIFMEFLFAMEEGHMVNNSDNVVNSFIGTIRAENNQIRHTGGGGKLPVYLVDSYVCTYPTIKQVQSAPMVAQKLWSHIVTYKDGWYCYIPDLVVGGYECRLTRK